MRHAYPTVSMGAWHLEGQNGRDMKVSFNVESASICVPWDFLLLSSLVFDPFAAYIVFHSASWPFIFVLIDILAIFQTSVV